MSTNAAGCPETNILALTINESNTGVDTQEHCDEYTWIDGITYTESNNTATHVLTNANDCDSVVTLDLTLNYSSIVNESQTACDSYDWNGQTYDQSGSYTYMSTNAAGCPETNILALVVNNSSSSYDTVIVCDEYEWNGITYTESGNYTYENTNSLGCDSIANLNLNVSILNDLQIDGSDIGFTGTSDNIYSIINPSNGSIYHWTLSEPLGIIESANQDSSQINISWGPQDEYVTLCVYEQDEYDCLGEESCINIDLKRPTSINEVVDNPIVIYPNPFRNETTLKFSNPENYKVVVQLFDTRGKMVRIYDDVKTEKLVIKKEDLSEGIYLIQLNLNNRISRHSIVIQ